MRAVAKCVILSFTSSSRYITKRFVELGSDADNNENMLTTMIICNLAKASFIDLIDYVISAKIWKLSNNVHLDHMHHGLASILLSISC